MKKEFNTGYFLIISALITAIVAPLVTYFLTSKDYEVKIENIKEHSILKEDIKESYVEKNEYETIKKNLNIAETNFSHDIESYKKQIDSLTEEMRFIRLKCEKISKIPSPKVKLEIDNTLFEIEKVYREGKYIVVDIRITNLGNDKERYGLQHRETVIKTNDGMEYEVKNIYKGGQSSRFNQTKYDMLHKEEILYSLYCGEISSQLNYSQITFKSITSSGSAILEDIAL